MGVRMITVIVAIIATLIWRDYVIQGKFMCPTHSEAKLTETLEFGAEKGALQGRVRRIGQRVSGERA